MNKNVVVSNSNIVFSDIQENDTYLMAKFVVCDFEPNLNGVMLNRQTIGNWINTLIDQPVVGKIDVTSDDGEADFTSHNANFVIRTDENGNPYQDIKFDTSAVGVFTDVDIESISGKEYIVADAKIWKRFPDVCALIKKRMSDGQISTSWEILVKSSHNQFISGQMIEVIDDGAFEGHCLLGQAVPPAYPDSKMLQVAAKQEKDNIDIELVDAIKRDIKTFNVSNIHLQKKDGDNVTKKDNKVSVSASEDGVVPKNISNEKADEGTKWTAPTLSDFTDKSWDKLTNDEKTKIAEHYAWAKAVPPENFGDLKLPHHEASDGKVVWNAVVNAAARLDQTDIPDGIVDKVKAHLEAHYHQFDKKAPWEDGKVENSEKKEPKAENVSKKTDTNNNSEIEKSELTDNDVMQGLYNAISEKLGIPYYYFCIIANIVTTNTVWVQRWDSDNASELDVLVFTYTVDNDVVTVSDPTEEKLTVSVSEINNKVAELNTNIEKQNASLVEASSKLKELNTQIAELTPFKEAADKAEKERIEAETASKREDLKKHALKSGLITESEFESDENIKASIDNVSQKDLDAIIAERFIASLDKKEEENNIKTSSVEPKKDNNTKLNLSDASDSKLDPKEIMRAYLGK